MKGLKIFSCFFFFLIQGTSVLPGQSDDEFLRKHDSLWGEIYTKPEKVLLEAQNLYSEALKQHNLKIKAKLENLIGSVYVSLNDYPKAMKYMLKSLESNKKIGDIRGVYVNLSNLGAICIKLKEYEKAKNYLNKALPYFEKQKEYSGLGNIYNNIGICEQSLKMEKKALQNFKNAIYYFGLVNEKENIFHTLLNIGDNFIRLENKDSALTYFNMALKIADTLSNDQFRFTTLNSMYALTKNKKILKKIFSLDVNQLFPEQQMEYFKLKKEYYSDIKNYEKSLQYFVLYDSIKSILETSQKNYEAKILLMQNEFNEIKKEDSIRVENERKMVRIQMEKQRAENQRNNILKWSFIIISCIIGVFLMVLFNRFKLIRKQKNIIEKQQEITEQQKRLLEIKQKEILDSINYAQRIQQSLIKDSKEMFRYFTNHFFIYLPKDIVSGDFIWYARQDDFLFVCCCDSTGHGVPGSYMSLLNIAFLSEAINEKKILEPNMVFDYVRQRLVLSIGKEKENKDGFDGALLRFHVSGNKINITKPMKWVSANQRILFVHNNNVEILNYQNMPVGYYEKMSPFESYEKELHPGDKIILSSDGYYDQFGGERNKKFTFKRYSGLISNSASLAEIEEKLLEQFHQWKASYEQTDDVCVVGLEI